MSNEKYCQNCGAKNQPYAAVCADCGNSFLPASEESLPVPPPPPPLEEPLDEEPLYEAPVEPSPRFKKRYILYAVLAVLLLFVVVGAISASFQTANRSIATPSVEASSIGVTPAPMVSKSGTATVTPSVSASPSPAQSVLPDYASRLNTVGLGAGLTTASQFEKATINGKTAYAGTLVMNGQTYNTQVYPMNSYSEALAFKDQLIRSYQSQGYATYNPGNSGDPSLNIWYGLSGNTLVSVTAMPTSQIDAPLVLVMTPAT
ncbi:MAG: zinc ribbon domain-containing protein [Halobacteriota archaeon]